MKMIPSQIRDSVYREPLPHDNRKFGMRYYGMNRAAVIREAEAAVKRVDPYRQPHIKSIYERNYYWNVEIAWYSLD
jgi:hypothetical protein